MLDHISLEVVPKNEVPTGPGRPGRPVPDWVWDSIRQSAEDGTWLGTLVTDKAVATELMDTLKYVHRATREPYDGYRLRIRHKEESGGFRVAFQAYIETSEGTAEEVAEPSPEETPDTSQKGRKKRRPNASGAAA